MKVTIKTKNMNPSEPTGISVFAEKPKKFGRLEQIAFMADRSTTPIEGTEDTSKADELYRAYGLAQNFVESALSAADHGELVASGNSGIYVRAQIEAAFKKIIDIIESSQNSEKQEHISEALMDFPRALGLRDGVQRLIESDGMSAAFVKYVTDRDTEQRMSEELRISPDLAHKEGHVALEAAGTNVPQELITEIPQKILDSSRSPVAPVEPVAAPIEKEATSEPEDPQQTRYTDAKKDLREANNKLASSSITAEQRDIYARDAEYNLGIMNDAARSLSARGIAIKY